MMQEKASKRLLLLTICLAQFLTMQNWFNFSAVLPAINRTWQLSSSETGMVIAIFQAGYIFSVFFIGILSDRYNPRKIFIISALATGIVNFIFGTLASGFTSALIIRALAGISIGGIYVPGMKLLAQLFPSSERGKAIGMYVGSLVVGSAFSLILASQLVGLLGWKWVVYITSIGAIFAGIIMSFVQDGVPVVTNPYSLNWNTIKRVVANRPAVLMNSGYMGHMWELYAMWGWIGPFMVSSFLNHGFTKEAATSWGNLLAGLIIAVGGIATAVTGKFSDKVGRIPTIKLMLGVSALCSLGFGWLINSGIFVLVTIGLIYGFTIVGDSPIFSVGLTELAEEQFQGITLGFQSVTGFGITVISPAVFGFVLDLTNNQNAVKNLGYYPVWGWAFASLSIGAILGYGAIKLLQHHPEKVKMANGKG